jgi:formylglycine-generating enzyme required for sulfatase activity
LLTIDAHETERPNRAVKLWPDMNDGLSCAAAKGLIPAVALAVCCHAQALQIEFVEIPAGEFTMGCLPSESAYMPDGSYEPCQKRAQPAHRVSITRPFEMSKYEVTQAQWEAVMGANPSYFKGTNRPVEQVGVDDVQGFLARLNATQDGHHYRLPTEAEWEYAARAGDAGEFPDSPSLSETAWFGEGQGSLTASPGGTHPVGQKRPNAWGLYDMRGNVDEWVSDWIGIDWRNDDYSKSTLVDPQGPATGKYHLTRGGSWFSNATFLRASNRYPCACRSRRDIGFRIVRVVQ